MSTSSPSRKIRKKLEGHLEKLGEKGITKSYKKRFFCLSDDGLKLNYYEREDKKKLCGFIDVQKIQSIEKEEENVDPSNRRKSARLSSQVMKYPFVIKIDGRDYHLIAETETKLKYWMNGINSLIKPLIPTSSAPPVPKNNKRASVIGLRGKPPPKPSELPPELPPDLPPDLANLLPPNNNNNNNNNNNPPPFPSNPPPSPSHPPPPSPSHPPPSPSHPPPPSPSHPPPPSLSHPPPPSPSHPPPPNAAPEVMTTTPPIPTVPPPSLPSIPPPSLNQPQIFKEEISRDNNNNINTNLVIHPPHIDISSPISSTNQYPPIIPIPSDYSPSFDQFAYPPPLSSITPIIPTTSPYPPSFDQTAYSLPSYTPTLYTPPSIPFIPPPSGDSFPLSSSSSSSVSSSLLTVTSISTPQKIKIEEDIEGGIEMGMKSPSEVPPTPPRFPPPSPSPSDSLFFSPSLSSASSPLLSDGDHQLHLHKENSEEKEGGMVLRPAIIQTVDEGDDEVVIVVDDGDDSDNHSPSHHILLDTTSSHDHTPHHHHHNDINDHHSTILLSNQSSSSLSITTSNNDYSNLSNNDYLSNNSKEEVLSPSLLEKKEEKINSGKESSLISDLDLKFRTPKSSDHHLRYQSPSSHSPHHSPSSRSLSGESDDENKGAMKDLVEENKKLVKEVEHWHGNYNEEKEKCAQVMLNYKTSNDYVLQLQQQMDDIKKMMNNDLQQKKLKITSQANQIQQLLADVSSKSDEISRLNHQLLSSPSSSSPLAPSNDPSTGDLQLKVQVLSDQNNTLVQQNSLLQIKCDELQLQFHRENNLNDNNNQLIFEELKRNHQNDIKQMELMYENKLAQLEERYSFDIKKLQSENFDMFAQSQRIQNQLQLQSQNQHQLFQSENSHLQQSLHNLHDQLTLKNEEIQTLTYSNQTLSLQLDNLNHQLQNTLNNHEILKDKCSALETDLLKKSTELSLHLRSSSLSNENNYQLNILQKKYDNLKLEYQKQKEEYDSLLDEKTDEHARKLRNLQYEIQARDRQISFLQSQSKSNKKGNSSGSNSDSDDDSSSSSSEIDSDDDGYHPKKHKQVNNNKEVNHQDMNDSGDLQSIISKLKEKLRREELNTKHLSAQISSFKQNQNNNPTANNDSNINNNELSQLIKNAEDAEQSLFNIRSTMQLYEEKSIQIQKMIKGITTTVTELVKSCEKTRHDGQVNRNVKDEIFSLRKLNISIISSLSRVLSDIQSLQEKGVIERKIVQNNQPMLDLYNRYASTRRALYFRQNINISEIESEMIQIKKDYFFAVAVGIKLNMSMQGLEINDMDLNSLYEVAVKSVVYQEWKNWLSLQFQSNTRSRAPPSTLNRNNPSNNNPSRTNSINNNPNNKNNNANRTNSPNNNNNNNKRAPSKSVNSVPTQTLPINKAQKQIVVPSKVNNTYEENMIEQRYQKQLSSIVTKPSQLHYSSDISISELNLDTDMDLSLDSLKHLESFDF